MASLLSLIVLVATFLCSEGSSLSRIIGGQNVPITDVPWQASLRRGGSHICGASFIDNKWLVTAAHCVDNQNVADLTVGYGNEDLRLHDQAQISNIYMHPDYSDDGTLGYPNDVAVLELSTPVTFDSVTNKIDLPKSDIQLTECAITGWGCINNIIGICFNSPNLLQGTFISKISPESCKDLWSDTQIQDIHVCVQQDSKSGCSGDSGGPMSCMQDGKVVLAGSTSWGSSSCDPAYPTVYARISEFVPWITFITKLEL